MKRLAVSLVLVCLIIPGAANAVCPEGTIAGQCVNTNLAADARHGAVVRTEIELSISSHNYPPSEDSFFAWPNDALATRQFGSAHSRGDRPQFISVPAIVYGIRN